MKTIQPLLHALGIAIAVAVFRWIYECMLVVPLVPDPQSGIWVMISTITSIFIAITLAPLAWLALWGQRSSSQSLRLLAVVPLLALLGWYSIGFIHLVRLRSALLDSENPRTSEARLRELADFQGGPGYEIDNRIARNPNTPPDVLRSLHGRPDQDGTEMCLAENPRTPDDILLEFARRNDADSKYIQDALARNPRAKELLQKQAAN